MKKKIAGTILIILGAIIIASAVFMRYSAVKKQKDMITKFEKTLKDMGDNEVNNEKNGTSSSPKDSPDKDALKAIAIMEIPKINLDAAVAEGTDVNTLRYAIGHFEGTALPGKKGNFCVAGHRNYTYSEYFKKADELTNGDEIILKTKEGNYTYKVTDKKIVEPEEVSVLNPTKEATITIVTCTPGATKRLIIKGELSK